jgi:hypothetical protein
MEERRALNRGSIVVLALAFGCRASPTATQPQAAPAALAAKPPTPAPAADPRGPLATFGTGRFRYQLSGERDKKPDPLYQEVPWRFHVRLLDDGGRVIDDQSPFTAACDQAEPTNVALVPGADPEAQAWRSVYLDKCEILLAARLVELGPGVSALLVTQQSGQEDIYQLHWLFLEQDGKLEQIWVSPTGPGHDSRVRVLPTGDKQQDDVAFIDAESPSLEEPHTLHASRLHFDRTNGLKTTPLPDARTPLFVSSLGTFKTARAALDAWAPDRPCGFHYRVFKASRLQGARARGFLLATVLARQEDVNAEKSALSQCAHVPTPSIIELRGSR